MKRKYEQEKIRLEIANVLDAIAAQSDWRDELWSRFESLMGQAPDDGLLAHAYDELIHYSGELNARNLLLMRVKPDEIQVSQYKDEFRQIASAIRSGMTWEEYERTFEAGTLNEAIKKGMSRVRKFLRRGRP